MKEFYLAFCSILFLFGCDKSDNSCPKNWNLDVQEVGSSATIDSSQLVLQTWNPVASDVIELNQTGLQGDFDVSIELKDFTWDSLVYPQLRFEIFDPTNISSSISGVAVNPNAMYCYVGSGPSNRDMRLIHHLTGNLRIQRIESVMTCSATLDSIYLGYSDTLSMNDLTVRLVLGSTAPSVGNTSVRLDSFESSSGFIESDSFECRSW